MVPAERLREIRLRRNMTQAELAAKVGVHPTSVVAWESNQNHRNMSQKHLAAVAEALQVKMSELFDEKPAIEPGGSFEALSYQEKELVRHYRLMSEKLQLLQLLQFVETTRLSQSHEAEANYPGVSGDAVNLQNVTRHTVEHKTS